MTVVTPINPNKIQPSSSERSAPADETKGRKTTSGSTGTSTSSETAAPMAGDTLNVDKASTLYRHANAQPVGNDAIDSPETALELAATIARQIQEYGTGALLAQAGSMSSNVGVLLQAAPA